MIDTIRTFWDPCATTTGKQGNYEVGENGMPVDLHVSATVSKRFDNNEIYLLSIRYGRQA